MLWEVMVMVSFVRPHFLISIVTKISIGIFNIVLQIRNFVFFLFCFFIKNNLCLTSLEHVPGEYLSLLWLPHSKAR